MSNTAGNSYLMVFSNPIEGKEVEYNDWYNNVHLKEAVAVDGVLSAQRFCLSKAQMNEQPYKYAVIYEVEKGNEATTLENLLAATEAMDMQPVMDLEKIHVQIIEAITEVFV